MYGQTRHLGYKRPTTYQWFSYSLIGQRVEEKAIFLPFPASLSSLQQPFCLNLLCWCLRNIKDWE